MNQANETTPPAPPAPEAAQKGFVARVIGVFFSPGETFEDVRRKPTVLVPMLVLMVLMMGLFWFITPASTADQQLAPQFQSLTEEQQQQQLAITSSMPARIAGTVIAPIAIILISLFFGLVYWGAGNLLGGEPTYKAMVSMIFFVGFLNPMLHFLVKLPLILAKNSVIGVTFGPAMFLPDLQLTSLTYLALSLLDIFNIWSVVVTGIGISKISKISTTAGMAIAIVVFAIAAGIQIGLRAAFS